MLSPFAKSPTLYPPKYQRLPRRKVVTIAAGFVARDGIVLCADTQETYGQLLKLNTPKIIVRPDSFIPGGPRIVFAGAGHGPFIDKLANEAWKKVSTRSPVGQFAEVCDDIESSIKDVYGEFGRIYQSGAMPEAELIYAVAVGSKTGLFKAHGPIVNPVSNYASVGVGLYLADYINARLGLDSPELADSRWYEILAIYLLQQATEYIEGCGGDSHVLTLMASGRINRLDPADVSLIANHISALDRNSSSVLMSSPDLKLSNEEFEGRIEIFITLARKLRAAHGEERIHIELMRQQNPLYRIIHREKENES